MQTYCRPVSLQQQPYHQPIAAELMSNGHRHVRRILSSDPMVMSPKHATTIVTSLAAGSALWLAMNKSYAGKLLR
jgi:hypothetical protein